MPPNAKGGKGYKKGKHSSDNVPPYIDRLPGQMIGRVVRILGNRNMLTYCNDKIVRICHICGKMKGRVFVGTGDIVLLSLRDFGEDTSRGDIIGKYATEHISSLRKEVDVNPNIFLKLETMKNMTIENVGKESLPLPSEEGEDFEFEEGDDEAGNTMAIAPKAVAPKPVAPKPVATKPDALDDFDIDAI